MDDDTVTEGRIEGALTQGLRLLRQQADHSPISFSPPESPILFSLSDRQDELRTPSLKFIFTCLRFPGVDMDARQRMDSWTSSSSLTHLGLSVDNVIPDSSRIAIRR